MNEGPGRRIKVLEWQALLFDRFDTIWDIFGLHTCTYMILLARVTAKKVLPGKTGGTAGGETCAGNNP